MSDITYLTYITHLTYSLTPFNSTNRTLEVKHVPMDPHTARLDSRCNFFKQFCRTRKSDATYLTDLTSLTSMLTPFSLTN